MKNYKLSLILLLLLVSIKNFAAEVQVGAGVFATSLPKYLGSNEQDTYVLPFPYFYYKSEKIEIDRNAFTGFLWHHNSWYLDFSVSGNIPVKSNETKLRQNMANIDFVGELGPALKYYIIGDPNASKQLNIALNIRKAYSSDFTYLSSVGWNYGPSLSYQSHISSVFDGELKASANLSINLADKKYLNYYYGVDEQDQLPTRPLFDVEPGYHGSSLSLGISWKKEKLWLGSFLKYNNLQGSTQQNSPLINAQDNWTFGFGLVWIFYNSQ